MLFQTSHLAVLSSLQKNNSNWAQYHGPLKLLEKWLLWFIFLRLGDGCQGGLRNIHNRQIYILTTEMPN